MLFLQVHSSGDASPPLFPDKRGLRYSVPSSLTRLGWFSLPTIDQYSSLLPPVGVWSVSQYQCGDLPLRTPTHRRLGGRLPRLLPNAPHAHPCPVKPFLPPGCPGGIYAGLARLSAGCPLTGAGCIRVTHPCVGRKRRKQASSPLPLDLHVLSLPLAFILSQDQTLRCLYYSFLFYSLGDHPCGQSVCLDRIPFYVGLPVT